MIRALGLEQLQGARGEATPKPINPSIMPITIEIFVVFDFKGAFSPFLVLKF